MKNMFRMFAFAGALGFGWIAFGDEENTGVKTPSEESIHVVCPEGCTEKNCEDCKNCDTAKAQPVAKSTENK